MTDHNRRFVHERAREAIAAPGDVSVAIGLAGLVAAWREPKVRTHRSRSGKSTGVFNRADVHQRRKCTDTRYRHQKTADRIHPDLLLHRLIKDRDLLAQVPPGDKQWTHDHGDVGSAVEQRFDLLIKSEPPSGAGQQAEGLQYTAYHVGEPRRHAHELSASPEESSRAMRIEGLHVDRGDTIPCA